MIRYRNLHRRVEQLEPVRQKKNPESLISQKALRMLSDEDLHALLDVLSADDRKEAEKKHQAAIQRYYAAFQKAEDLFQNI